MDKDKDIIDRKHWFPDMYMLNDIRKDKILKMLKIDGKELLEDEGFNQPNYILNPSIFFFIKNKLQKKLLNLIIIPL